MIFFKFEKEQKQSKALTHNPLHLLTSLDLTDKLALERVYTWIELERQEKHI